MSTLALGFTLAIGVGGLYFADMRLGPEADHSFHLVPRGWAELYLNLPCIPAWRVEVQINFTSGVKHCWKLEFLEKVYCNFRLVKCHSPGVGADTDSWTD
jgi:hypothetical protein